MAGNLPRVLPESRSARSAGGPALGYPVDSKFNDLLSTVGIGANDKGGGRIRTDDNGFAIRHSKNQTSTTTKTCETAKQQLTLQLTAKSSKQPEIDLSELPLDLAEIVAIWPELPSHIKAAIKALVATITKGDHQC